MIQLEKARVRAPDFPRDASWLNVSRPLSLEELRGHVVLLDFWTYCCINCLHVLPDLERIERHFAGQPLAIVGVHAAKFTSEKDAANVAKAVARHRIAHPVLVDSEHEIWSEYAVRSWPTLVGIDATGKVAFTAAGEPQLAQLVDAVARLLDEGARTGTLASQPLHLEPTLAIPRAGLAFPGRVHVEGDRLFVADTGHHRILIADIETGDGGWPTARLRDVAGSGAVGAQSGAFEVATFQGPQGMAIHDGKLVVADTENHLLRSLDLERRTVETIAGTGEKGGVASGDDSDPLATALRSPWDVCSVGSAVVIAMAGSHQLWTWGDEGRNFGAVVGTGAEGHVDGAFESAALAQPSGLARAGRFLLVADSEVSSVRVVDMVDREVMTVVGRGLFDFGDVDGSVDEALLQHPLDVAVIDQTVFVADTFNNKVRAVDLETQRVRTVAGDGTPTLLDHPGGIDVWRDKLIVADTNHHRVVAVDPVTGEVRPLDGWVQ